MFWKPPLFKEVATTAVTALEAENEQTIWALNLWPEGNAERKLAKASKGPTGLVRYDIFDFWS